MKSWFAVLLAFTALSSYAHAAGTVDPLAPVKAVISIVEKNDSAQDDSDADYVDYLSGVPLHENFSVAFAAIAEKGEAQAEQDDQPFVDYEPVLGGQDSCPMKDLSLTNDGEKDGVYTIVAKFKASYCFTDGGSNAVSETDFKVIAQDGKPVIDDIINIVPDSEPLSLKDVMKSYFEQPQDQKQDQPAQ